MKITRLLSFCSRYFQDQTAGRVAGDIRPVGDRLESGEQYRAGGARPAGTAARYGPDGRT